MIFKKSDFDNQPPEFMKDSLVNKQEITTKLLGDFIDEQKRMIQYYKNNIEDSYDRGFADGFARMTEELYNLYRKLI